MGLVISKGLTLKSYNTPAAIAGVAPTLDYRFALDRREIEAISLTDKLTYTGATNGTFVNRSGLVERATTDLPRFDHGPVSRQSLGLLVEEARTNLLVRSEEFDNASWIKFNTTLSPNQIVAPDGLTSADKVIETATNTEHNVRQDTVSQVAGTYTLSIFAKAGERDVVQFVSTGLLGGFRANFDLTNGVLGSVDSSLGAEITVFPNGWYRCSVTRATTSSGTLRAQWNIVTSPTAPRVESYLGDVTKGLYLWGAQTEAGAFPTSYIPTTTTALTRPVDSAVIDGTGVITGTYTLVEQPAGCAVVNGTNIDLVSGFTAERVMVFPAALSAPQITAIRGAM
jgi:hypothetical protein